MQENIRIVLQLSELELPQTGYVFLIVNRDNTLHQFGRQLGPESLQQKCATSAKKNPDFK